MKIWVWGVTVACTVVASATHAETTTNAINVTIPDNGGQQSFDINGDNLLDVTLGFNKGMPFIAGETSADFDAGEPGIDDGTMYVTKPLGEGIFAPSSVTSFQVVTNPWPVDGDITSVQSVGDIKRYKAGDTVQQGLNIGTETFEFLDDPGNFLPEGGFIGLEIETGTGLWLSGFELTDTIRAEVFEGEFFFDGFVGETTTTFAFIEVNQGSLVIGQSGFNSLPGAGALIPNDPNGVVPLPAGVWLLGGALLGAGALTRRRRS